MKDFDDWKKEVYDEMTLANKTFSGNGAYEDLRRRFIEGDFSRYREQVLPRNLYGQPMFSEHCKECYKHDEGWETCDLCGQPWVSMRIHVVAEQLPDMPIPQFGNSKKWEEERIHECPETKKFLTQLLVAVIL